MRFLLLALFGLFTTFARAQTTLTTIDENAQTVVEVVSTDLDGDLVTETLLTLTGPLTTTTTGRTTQTTTTTTPDDQVVGAPAPTVGEPHAPIPFQYITTQGGEEVTIDAVFTPTFPTTTPTTAPATGSIMAYSDYTAQFTQTAGVPNSAQSVSISRAVAGSFVACMLGGAAILIL